MSVQKKAFPSGYWKGTLFRLLLIAGSSAASCLAGIFQRHRLKLSDGLWQGTCWSFSDIADIFQIFGKSETRFFGTYIQGINICIEVLLQPFNDILHNKLRS